MNGYEWYPLAIQFWIWGVSAISVTVIAVLLWFLWGRPLRVARIVLEETDGYRALAVMDSKQRIDRIIDHAETEIMNNLVGIQLRDIDCHGQAINGFARLVRYGDDLKRNIIDVDDAS